MIKKMIIEKPKVPSKSEYKKRNESWAQELLVNKKKCTGQMRKKGGRCCLQVAEDLAIEMGLKILRSRATDSNPRWAVAEFYGWESADPLLLVPTTGEPLKLEASVVNDSDHDLKRITTNKQYIKSGLPHSKIAECVLNTFCREKPVWTFKV